MSTDTYLMENAPEEFMQEDESLESNIESKGSLSWQDLEDKGLKLDRDTVKYIGWLILTAVSVMNYLNGD